MFHFLKTELFKLKQFTIIKMCFSLVNLMHDIAYLAITYWKKIINYLDISKAIPLQALTGPEGFRRFRLPDF
jgi:hypothetical protein